MHIYFLLACYLQSTLNGMHVIYVPPAVLKNAPAMWLQMVTKHRGELSNGIQSILKP